MAHTSHPSPTALAQNMHTHAHVHRYRTRTKIPAAMMIHRARTCKQSGPARIESASHSVLNCLGPPPTLKTGANSFPMGCRSKVSLSSAKGGSRGRAVPGKGADGAPCAPARRQPASPQWGEQRSFWFGKQIVLPFEHDRSRSGGPGVCRWTRWVFGSEVFRT